MKNRLQKNKGFTLIELMVVVTILSILTVISVPAMAKWIPNYRLSESVRNLQSAVQKTRGEAIKRNRTLWMDFDFDADRCSVFLDIGTTAGQLDANDIVIGSLLMSSGVDFYEADSGAGPIQFNSRGMLISSDLLKLRNAQGRYRGVAIRITGKSQIVKSTDSGSTWQ